MEISEDGVITGMLLKCGVPNANGVVYTTENTKEAIKEFKADSLFGTVGSTNFDGVGIDRYSHVVTKIEECANGDIVLEAKILPTRYGSLLEKMIKNKTPLRVGRRGSGIIKEVDGQKIVTEYKLVGIDFLID
ncbi:MAG: hypothetical protein HQK96_08100 [Nitrospirae bacterium]|nr:hypothetical protein [Nitrospirota bacterium]